jgi:hypothetical protein
MSEPIAFYRESRGLRRRFTLYRGRVHVSGKGLKFGQFDEVIPLSSLHPEPSRVWVRGVLFWYGITALACAAGSATAALAVGGGPAIFFLRPGLGVLVGGLALVGALLALTYARPVEFAKFRTDSGLPGLDVARVGPKAEDFDEFVGLLIAEIQEAKAPPEPLPAQPIFDPRLYGTWLSDTDATLDHLRSVPQCSWMALAAIARILGKLRITYGSDTVTYGGLEMDGTYTYRVVKRSSLDVVVHVTSDNYPGTERRTTITFGEDGFWVETADPRLWWYREKFVRVPEAKTPPDEQGGITADRPRE